VSGWGVSGVRGGIGGGGVVLGGDGGRQPGREAEHKNEARHERSESGAARASGNQTGPVGPGDHMRTGRSGRRDGRPGLSDQKPLEIDDQRPRSSQRHRRQVVRLGRALGRVGDLYGDGDGRDGRHRQRGGGEGRRLGRAARRSAVVRKSVRRVVGRGRLGRGLVAGRRLAHPVRHRGRVDRRRGRRVEVRHGRARRAGDGPRREDESRQQDERGATEERHGAPTIFETSTYAPLLSCVSLGFSSHRFFSP